MKLKILLIFGCVLFSFSAIARDQAYCPGGHGQIRLEMTEQQVIAACGPPISKREAGGTLSRQVPVSQLIYTTLQTDSTADNPRASWGGINNLYKQWSLPSGTNQLRLEVNIVDGKVKAINLNGSSVNAQSVCAGGSFAIGDDEIRVRQACGSPNVVNETFVTQPVPSDQQPQIWIYRTDQYQPPLTLTIINGRLKSIN
jgi:hypothetical protein